MSIAIMLFNLATMGTYKRLPREAVKKRAANRVPTWLDHAYRWIESNWKQAIAGVVSLAVVVAVVFIAVSYFKSSGNKAKDLLFTAQKAAGQGQDAVTAYEKVIKEYPDSTSAQIARLELGNIFLGRNELTKAQEFIAPVAKAKNPILRVIGLNNLAAAKLSSGDAKGAAEAYMQAYNDAGNPAKGVSYFNAALAYKKAGDNDSARKIFEGLSKEAAEFSTPELRERSKEQLIWMAVK